MKELLGIIALSLVIGLAIGFGGGWTIKDWKDGSEIAALQSRVSVSNAANQKCETDIADVRRGVSGMVKAAEDRAKKAETAMLDAQSKATKHTVAAKAIREAPVRQDEPTCDAVFGEQMEYVQKRRDS